MSRDGQHPRTTIALDREMVATGWSDGMASVTCERCDWTEEAMDLDVATAKAEAHQCEEDHVNNRK